MILENERFVPWAWHGIIRAYALVELSKKLIWLVSLIGQDKVFFRPVRRVPGEVRLLLIVQTISLSVEEEFFTSLLLLRLFLKIL